MCLALIGLSVTIQAESTRRIVDYFGRRFL